MRKLVLEPELTMRHCRYILAKLRRVDKRWPLSEDATARERLAVVGFVGYALALATELLRCEHQPLSASLLLRTLWHNAGQLAWLLHGPGNIADRLDAYERDYAIRAEESLITRPARIFGLTEARHQFKALGLEIQVQALKEDAARARQQQTEPGDRSEWARIKVAELWKALRRTFTQVKPQGESLDKLLGASEEAVAAGDDIAHPNPFTILACLDLVDPQTQCLVRKLSRLNEPARWHQSIMLLMPLLTMHAVVLTAYRPEMFPLEEVLEALINSTRRGEMAAP